SAAALPLVDPSPASAEPAASTVAALETRIAPSNSPPTAAVAVEAIDEALTPLARTDPQFPPSLLRSLRKGQVRVRFTVLPNGSVAEPAVVTSSNAKLNPAALAAIAQWRFAPVRQAQGGVVDLGFNLD
ncbi:MAG: TonB family protein, partial [Rhizobiales bacterium]|nr:TonB family protein [Rhizobacter sp.]